MNINTYVPNGFNSWTEFYRKSEKLFWAKNCIYLFIVSMCFVVAGMVEVM